MKKVIKEQTSHASRQENRDNGFGLRSLIKNKQNQGLLFQRRVQVIILGGIAVAEAIAMVVVYYVNFLPYYLQVILDAAVMTAIISPLLYYLSFKPIIVHMQQQYQMESITEARLRLMQFANSNPLDKLLQAILDEIEALTGGTIGFFHFIEADQKKLWLQTWSTNTIENMCKAEGKGSHYPIDQAGVWADSFWQRKPVVHNDYASLAVRRGLPKGHAPIIREMTIPIIRNNQVVAILGIGNKPDDFTETDVELASAIADFAWDIVDQKRAENALRESEEKFRNFVDWTYDWELWVDPNNTYLYCSPSCERITGWPAEAFMANPELQSHIVHPDDKWFHEDHQKIVHDPSAGPSQMEFRIVARDGSVHWIEHVCRPLFGMDDTYLGRRVSNRDVTERKRAEEEIQERHRREDMLVRTIQSMQMDIARDLHDTVGQNISYLRMKLDYLSEKSQGIDTEVNLEIRNMSKAANETYDLVRGTLALLHSESAKDLLDLFKQYAEQVSVRSTFDIDFTHYGEPKQISAYQMRQLFYVFREALSNIEKHANASHVSVEITWDQDHLVFVIYDNGQGFETTEAEKAGHYGIKSMQDRAKHLNGAIQVYSAPGAGTNIVLHAPYELIDSDTADRENKD